jgi:hypothetical protein
MLGKLSFIFDLLIICKIKILTNRTTALGMYTVLESRLITDWSFKNMNSDMPFNGMLLEASVSTIFFKRCNKHLILISLK